MCDSKCLLLALATLLVAGPSRAQERGDAGDATTARSHERQLDAVTVTASPLGQAAVQVLQPNAVIAGVELEERLAATIGQTVAQEPGVQSSNFGPGVGRPIIRGLEGARVQVLEGGIGALDLSAQSNDHAVTIDPFLADQVEVLKGPATLYYGGGAIGGVVNVVDGRIPEAANEGIGGRAMLGGTTASGERAGVLRIDAGTGSLALHADYARRTTDDVELPDDAILRNSATESTSRALGASFVGASGFAGLSVSTLESRYGIPLGSSAGPLDTDLESIQLDPQQTRIDAKVGLLDPFAGVEKLTLRAGHNDYEHNELSADGPGTKFTNLGIEARLEAVHAPVFDWQGAVGVQFVDRDFEAIGAETFVPPTAITDRGLFIVEQREFAPFKVEVGARRDLRELDVRDGPSVARGATSLSASAAWQFATGWSATLNVDRAARAPGEEELFANGAHDATGSFEVGDPQLRVEVANQVELGLAYESAAVQARAGAYRNRFDRFIYLAETGLVDPDEGLPIRQWSQDDARFSGFEGEIKARLADGAWGRFDLRVFGDTVRARLRDAGDLPRIAPARIGASLAWTRDALRASIGAVGWMRQDKVAAFEQPTSGFTLLDAHLSWALDAGPAEWELYLDGSNLTDRVAFVHTSLLKDRSPLPGRGIGFGVRAYF
jgi:iron complex outermembrane receptor protein